MSFRPLYEPAKCIAIRSRLVATMVELARIFGCDIVEVHKIAQRDLTDDELDRPASEPPL